MVNPSAQIIRIIAPPKVTARYTGTTSVIKNIPRPNRKRRPNGRVLKFDELFISGRVSHLSDNLSE